MFSNSSASTSTWGPGGAVGGAGVIGTGRKPTPEANIVDVDRIEQGLDTRTTVMLKNVPNKMSALDLIRFIHNVGFFFLIPWDGWMDSNE